jgi:hypothetical protein
MARKIFFILFLISLLVGFFYFRPLWTNHEPTPSLLDRIPDGDFLGRIYLLDVARESTPLTYHNKIPFRDLFSPEFMLAQAKSYGLDLQKPAYFFANDTGEWGAIIHVIDSSKIYSGVVRLQKNIDLRDTIVGEQKVFTFKGKQSYLTYGKDWIFIYKGRNLQKWMYHVIYSKKGDATKSWRTFEKEIQFKHEKLVVYSNYKRVQNKGFTTAMFAHDMDSTSFKIKAYMRSDVPLAVSPKKEGLSFTGSSGKLLNLHFNVHQLRHSTNDPYYKIMKGLSRRVSFPLQSFLNAWEGDLSYHQGGFINVKEKVIETALDENFNVSEKVVLKDKQVPAFALLFSINNNIHDLLYQLFVKGILRREENKLRFLFSPPIKMNLTPKTVYFYSSDNVPLTTTTTSNGGVWTYKGTKYEFHLDSMNQKETFGTINLPAKGLFYLLKTH